MFPHDLTKKKIVIIGQGAMGLLCYHHLQQAHNAVLLMDSTLRSKQLSQAPKSLTTHYSFTAYQTETAKNYPLSYAQSHELTQAELLILSVKSYQIASVIKAVTALIKPNCLVLLAHNGMGTLAEVKHLLPAQQRILAMLTTHASLRHSPLKLSHTGLGHTDLGLLAGNMTATEIDELVFLLGQAMPTVSFSTDITKKQWLKLAINCVINPITALNDIENGQVSLTKFTTLKAQLIDEVMSVAKAEAIDFTQVELTQKLEKVVEATAKNSSSMRCDMLAHRQTEVDYINGYIHHLGVKHSIKTPQNTALWQAIKQKESQKK